MKIKPLVDNSRTTRFPVLNITASATARLPSLNLPPKRPAMWSSIPKKTRKSLNLKVKVDIIHRHERRENYSIAGHHLDSIYCVYYFSVSRLY
ncbi:hypothetical protein E2C01_093019 [Portunus trituberculatus]|uniref:Uncharacterized protein n=1 Tax=Portunus trituberculatus TaxID=210409 RepID=A0A5B7JTF1_PORTR|nr:hypothetical protein [Portunus trituberculatus]